MVATWRDDAATISGNPMRWGTGINPVHAIVDNSGRNVAAGPANYAGPPEEITSESLQSVEQNVDTNDVWGDNEQTGMAEIPSIGSKNLHRRNVDDYPSWDTNGKRIRAQVKGSRIATLAKAVFSVKPYTGILGKEQGPENPAVVSDPAQYEIKTSMTQRDKTRNGSQSSRASKQTQTISSRHAGMKQPQIDSAHGETERTSAMLPKAQDTMPRAWWPRQAGTGPVSWMGANSAYESEAMTREAPPLPNTGPIVTYSGDYLDGDQVWW